MSSIFRFLVRFLFILFQGAEDNPDEKKFDPVGYDKNLVENLERDIVQRNPNVHW